MQRRADIKHENMKPMPVWKFKLICMAVAVTGGLITFLTWGRDHPSIEDERIIMVSAPTMSTERTIGAAHPPRMAFADATVPVAELPVAARGGSTQNGDRPPSVSMQNRDARWAAPTERDLSETLREIPFLAGGNNVSVHCGENICEARGEIDKKASTENRKLATQYLDGMDFAKKLGSVNALADEVLIDQSSGAFTIRFSRVHR